MICFRCDKKILEDEEYIKFTEYNKKEIVSESYSHKICWASFLKKLTDTNELMGMVKGLKGSLNKMGVLPDEEFVLK